MSLKRSGPLKRKTPLVQRTEIPRRRDRMKPVSKRRRKRDKDYDKARQAVFERADGVCEFAGWDWATKCWEPMVDTHHLAGRVGPDPHRLDNLIGLCRGHHDKAHNYPAWAYEAGLLVRRNGRAA